MLPSDRCARNGKSSIYRPKSTIDADTCGVSARSRAITSCIVSRPLSPLAFSDFARRPLIHIGVLRGRREVASKSPPPGRGLYNLTLINRLIKVVKIPSRQGIFTTLINRVGVTVRVKFLGGVGVKIMG